MLVKHRAPNPLGIAAVKIVFSFFLLLLSPLLIYNTYDHRQKIKRRPFYESLVVRLYAKYPLLYELYILVMNFPLLYDVYNVLPPLRGKVLQVGCGTGALNIYLKKKARHEGVQLVNLDPNLNSIRYGLKRKAFSDYVLGDITQAPFEDNSFDMVVFARSLHHIKKQKKALAECYRILKPGGKVIISDHISLNPTEPPRGYMMNSNIDGNIWRYGRDGFENHLRKNTPENLVLREIREERQVCVTNYNYFFPNADGLAVLEKVK